MNLPNTNSILFFGSLSSNMTWLPQSDPKIHIALNILKYILETITYSQRYKYLIS